MKRYKMSNASSRRSFTANGMRKHKRNFNTGTPMRGGIRL